MRLWTLALLACAHCGAPCVANGPSARCETLVCPGGAHISKGRCECSDGLSSFAGACVPAADREAVCGLASVPSEGGCAPKSCSVIDGATGVCLPVGSVRALAEPLQIALLADETLECNGETFALVAGGNSVACVPKENACGPGAVYEKKKCVAIHSCAPGEVPIGAGCERIVHPGDSGPLSGMIVDVATWVRAMLGVDGGGGSSFVCGGFQTAPWTFTPSTDVRSDLIVSIDVRVPDNDLTQARAHVDAMLGAAGASQPAPVEGLQHTVDRLISGLRALGGTSRASAVSTRVRCLLAVGGRPIAVPFARAPTR